MLLLDESADNNQVEVLPGPSMANLHTMLCVRSLNCHYPMLPLRSSSISISGLVLVNRVSNNTQLIWGLTCDIGVKYPRVKKPRLSFLRYAIMGRCLRHF
jgi:hypothetical protein